MILPVCTRGRPFQKGNGGRRPGSKNKATLVAQALAPGQADELIRKAFELAIAGNIPLLKLFIARLLPKERAVHIDLPDLDESNNTVDAFATIIQAVASCQISPNEAAALSNVVAQYARATDVADLQLRLDHVERKLEEFASILEQELKRRQ
jgi:hypothetical protein